MDGAHGSRPGSVSTDGYRRELRSPGGANEDYRALAEQATIDEHAKAFFDHLLPALNRDPSDLIDLLCQHPGISPYIGGSGNDLATFVVMPSGGSLLQMNILARYLTKSAIQQGCPAAVGHVEHLLSLNARGCVPGMKFPFSAV